MELRKSAATEYALSWIRNQIIDESWKYGQRLPSERALCDELNVSRSSVRSALQQLVATHMISSKQGSGSYVIYEKEKKPLDDTGNLTDLLEFRKIIETSSVELAAQRATLSEIKAMTLSVEKMGKAEKLEDILHYDWEFHTLIAKATHNNALINVFEYIKESYLKMLEKNISRRGLDCVDEHREIVTAIAAHSPVNAKAYMANHLDKAAMVHANEFLKIK